MQILIGEYVVIKIEKKYIGGHISAFIYKHQVSVATLNNKPVLCKKEENIAVSIPPKFIHGSDPCV